MNDKYMMMAIIGLTLKPINDMIELSNHKESGQDGKRKSKTS